MKERLLQLLKFTVLFRANLTVHNRGDKSYSFSWEVDIYPDQWNRPWKKRRKRRTTYNLGPVILTRHH